MTLEEKSMLNKVERINRWNAQKTHYCFRMKHKRTWEVKRGEVYFVDLGENIGSEENKIRPVVIIQANSYNKKSPVFICAIISTSPLTIPDIQVAITEYYPFTDFNGDPQVLSGAIDLGQIKTVAKERIKGKKICVLNAEMEEVNIKLLNIFGLTSILKKKDNQISSLVGKIEYLNEMLKSKK